MSTMIVILKGATSTNFPLVAEKRKLIRVSATVTATVIQITVWVANASMVETTIDVTPATIVNQDDAPLESLLATAEHGDNCIRNNDCASEHCLLSSCTDHRDGAHCVNDDDCLEGSSCIWSKSGATCKKDHGCTWWNWNECSEQCTWFQKVTFTCY